MLHAESASYDATDWIQIVRLYDLLAALDGSPVVLLNRAIAVGQIAGPETALREVDALADALDRYHLFHATRARLLEECGRQDEARIAGERALSLTLNPAERALLEERFRP